MADDSLPVSNPQTSSQLSDPAPPRIKIGKLSSLPSPKLETQTIQIRLFFFQATKLASLDLCVTVFPSLSGKMAFSIMVLVRVFPFFPSLLNFHGRKTTTVQIRGLNADFLGFRRDFPLILECSKTTNYFDYCFHCEFHEDEKNDCLD